MDQRLNIVTLGVRDVDNARKFYCGGLGWKESSASQPAIAFIDAGGVVLALFERRALAQDAVLDQAPPMPPGAFHGMTLAQNVRSKEAVDRALAQAVAVGAKLLKPGQDVFWGGYSGYFADPDGHIWEVAWNPFFRLDKSGRVLLPAPRPKSRSRSLSASLKTPRPEQLRAGKRAKRVEGHGTRSR